MKKINIIITLLIIFSGGASMAQKSNPEGPKFRVVFEKLPNSEKFSVDSVAVRWYKPYSVVATYAAFFKWLKPNSKGEATFSLPYEKEISSITHFSDLEFLPVESTDDITIIISKKDKEYSYVFKGKGSEKYNVAIKLRAVREKVAKASWDVENEKISLTEKLEKLNQTHKEQFDKAMLIVKNAKLDDKMKKIVSYGYIGLPDWNSAYYRLYTKNKDLLSRSTIKQNYNNFKGSIQYPIDNELMGFNLNYLLYLAMVDGNELSINSNQDTIKTEVLYHHFVKKYSGPLRDMMITNLFKAGAGVNYEIYRGTNPKVFDSLSVQAEKIVKLPTAKSSLMYRNRTVSGAPVPDASFIDMNGNTVKIADFKGKVVFLDLWGTGCSACAKYHKWFHKEVYPAYKENKDFVYLSISVDKTLERWKAALNTNKYSSLDYLNLNTEYLGISHPFMKYYNISAVPFLLIVGKDGKTVTGSVPSDMSVKKLLDTALAVDYKGK